MFSPLRGVAVAVTPSSVTTPPHGNCCGDVSHPRGDYLATTTDGGVSWTATGVLPPDVVPDQAIEVHLAFSTPTEGYVDAYDSATTIYTDDGGRTWSSLSPPMGQTTSISLERQALWIVSNFCPPAEIGPGLCPSRLLIYGRESSTPAHERPIPMAVPLSSAGVSGPGLAATLLDRLGPNSAVVEEGTEGRPSSLLFTDDGGLRWRTLVDPCEGLIPTGLVAPTPTTWDLYCQLDGGMNQGQTAFYTTTDDGWSWRLAAAADEEENIRGRLGDEMAVDLSLSRDGRVLWLLGTVGGIRTSTDGGREWTDVSLQTGGEDAELATAGQTRSWLPIPGFGLWATTDGRTWRSLT